MDVSSGIGATVGDTGASVESGGDTNPTLDSVFDAAIEESAGASPTPDSGTPTASSSTPAPATAAPMETPVGQPPQEAKPGEPPRERWDAILSNARTKARDEALNQIRAELGPRLEVLQRLQADPVGAVVQLQQEMLADPRFAAQLASESARILRSRRGVQAEDEEPAPDVDAGNGILLYSANQQPKRDQWLRNSWQRELQQALQPLQQYVQTAQQQEQQRAFQQAQTQRVTSRFDQWRQMPGFTEHGATIRAKQQQYYESGLDSWDALARAYAEVVTSASKQQGTQELRAQAAKQLQAATANPAASAPAKPRKATSLDDAFDLALAELGAT